MDRAKIFLDKEKIFCKLKSEISQEFQEFSEGSTIVAVPNVEKPNPRKVTQKRVYRKIKPPKGKTSHVEKNIYSEL